MSDQATIGHVAIGELLSSDTFSVPRFQRSFAWTNEEVDELLDDLFEAMDNESQGDYFLGTVLLKNSEDGETKEIVDGQQRLASVTMIYAAIRDHFYNIPDKRVAKRLALKYLYKEGTFSGDKSARVTLGTGDDSFFADYVLPDPDDTSRTGTAKPGRTSPASHQKIAKAFNAISNKIAERVASHGDATETLQSIAEYVRKKAKVIRVMVADDANAYQIFETLNDRGVDLAIVDLLKNYLFGHAGKPNKLLVVQSKWEKAIAHVIAVGGEKGALAFIHDFWASHNGLTRERDLYNAIRKKVKQPKEVLALMKDLEVSSLNYAAILNPVHTIWAATGQQGQEAITTLKSLKMEQYRALLLACMDTFGSTSPPKLKSLLRMLVNWSVRFRVTAQLGSNKLEKFYQNAGMTVRDKGITTATALLKEFALIIPSDAKFKSAFSSLDETDEARARYYLRSIEKTYRDRKGKKELEPLRDESTLNLEHVLPQNPNLEDWSDFDEDSAEVYLHRLGNLALLLKTENKGLGNKPFKDKKTVLSKSELESTKRVAKAGAWTPEEIQERQDWLAKLAIRTWPRRV